MELEQNAYIPKKNLISFLDNFSTPSPTDSLKRPSETQYKNLSERFLLPGMKNFNTQYCHFYFVRLTLMKPRLISYLKSINQKPISILSVPKNELCCVLGILYKEMKMKPNVLQKISGGMLDTTYVSNLSSYVSEDDILYIEDENGKVKLDLSQCSESIKHLCSGLVVGLSGVYDGKIFKVKNVFFSGFYLTHQENYLSLSNYFNQVKEDNKFIAFVSGLNINGSDISKDYHIIWLKQMLFGNLNNEKLLKIISKICRIVIAGNSIHREVLLENNAFMGMAKKQEITNKANIEIKKSMLALDDILQELSNNITIDILAGENEPNTNFFPNQPMNKLFFDKNFKNNHFQAVTNPYFFELDKRKILGSSGLNIHDLRKSCLLEENDVTLLENTLKWGHIAPTAPETISCYPYVDNDPFVLDELPDIYFCGNSDNFQTKLMVEQQSGKKTRILTVPKFHESNSIAIVNLENLDCFEICFNANGEI